MRLLAGVPRVLTPLALLAAVLGLVLPSGALAARSDLLLALLVLATALGISFADLARLREHARAVVILSLAPLPVLVGAAWLLGRPFAPLVRDGLLAVGLSSSEVAAVGLVALAGADATIALGVVTGSLVLAALVGPVAIGWLSGSAVHVSSGRLLGRFALVVLVPLLVGVAVRSRTALATRLAAADVDAAREGVAALTVAVLVYAALSGTHGAHHLGAALLASVAFLIVCACLAELWRRADGRRASAIPGAFTIAMRDFAVAAALATQAFGTAAGAVPGVYGVVMLVAAAIAAGRFSRA
ncbi:MAG TPA: bile acid:sodium symporter [Solirubrobacteraceae bacterium]|jgi:BASS family bile acid:Na+ symporter|nr:bile acid:sodium symporter [Solirubrobacteraceae bacterium]